tara:strand:+ start:89 stop:340 length:252 start_codon:yes stop_codon:yes gene_type:complete
MFFIIFSLLIGEDNFCLNPFISDSRSTYNIGDTLSLEDQNRLYPICNGSGNYQTGDNFSFSDLNGDLNGGDYKLTLISMNATW